jgi:hypothetical protein
MKAKSDKNSRLIILNGIIALKSVYNYERKSPNLSLNSYSILEKSKREIIYFMKNIVI